MFVYTVYIYISSPFNISKIECQLLQKTQRLPSPPLLKVFPMLQNTSVTLPN